MHKEKGYLAKKKILKSSNFLDLTPLPRYPHELDPNGNVVLLVPRFTGFPGKQLLQHRLKNPYIKISLDETGSETWLLANGKTSVREICRLADEKLGEKINPVHDRVTTFFSQLYMRKLITFIEILK